MFKRIIVRVSNFFYRVFLKNLLRLSKLGKGFIVEGAESGENFEHIYNNKAEGFFLIGSLIDRILLNLPSVKATRERKNEIKKILSLEIRRNWASGKKTRVLDLASGGARYLRELTRDHGDDLVESFCVDKNKNCVLMGRQFVMKDSLVNLRFFRGNVFRLEHLKALSRKIKWQPNVVIASGFFIYFNDKTVESLLMEIRQILAEGGLIIFQSYERLTSRKLMRKTSKVSTGEQWTLYYRKPEFWHTLLYKLKFADVLVLRDQWLMNNICVARKSQEDI